MRIITPLLLVLVLLGCTNVSVQPKDAETETKSVAPQPIVVPTEAQQMDSLRAFVQKKLGVTTEPFGFFYSSPACCGTDAMDEAKISPAVTEYLCKEDGWKKEGAAWIKPYLNQTGNHDRQHWFYTLEDNFFHGKSIILGSTKGWLKSPEGTWGRTTCYVFEIKPVSSKLSGARTASPDGRRTKDGIIETR